jgi:sugar O-acyltransferase (sialic acid O-acetyltransferase NeuD family)
MVDIVQNKRGEENKKLQYNIIIVGAGGFGREVYLWAKDIFSKEEYSFKGFIDDNNKALKNYNMDIDIIGNIKSYLPQEEDRFLFAIGDINKKKKIIEKLKKKNAIFLKLIHPTALVSENAKIGDGVIICPFCIVSDHVLLGDFVMMNAYSSCGHDAIIGKYSILSSYSAVGGFALLEEEVFFGLKATIIPGKKVGYKSKVSANSVVMRDVPPNRMVFGVPGKVI